MTTLLLPCDGTPNALHAVRHAVDAYRLRSCARSKTRSPASCSVPVEVVAGAPASALERVGIPAGVGAGMALLWVGGS